MDGALLLIVFAGDITICFSDTLCVTLLYLSYLCIKLAFASIRLE